jgi:hypothetical protein
VAVSTSYCIFGGKFSILFAVLSLVNSGEQNSCC